MEAVMRQTWAFLFRGYHITRRYIGWVVVFNFYALVTSATVALIGVAQSILTNRLRPIAVGGNPTTDGLGGQILKREYEQMRWSAGVKGEIAKDLNFDVAATYIIEDQVQQTPDVLIDRLQRASVVKVRAEDRNEGPTAQRRASARTDRR